MDAILNGWDWFWVILAFIIDIGHAAGTGYSNRNSIPGVSSSTSTGGTPAA